MALNKNSEIWMSSAQVKSKAKIKGCDLMHYRNNGKILFIKKGNTFFYNKKCVEILSKIKVLISLYLI